MGDVGLENVVDVAPVGMVLAKVRGVSGRRMQVPLHGHDRRKAMTGEARRHTPAPREEVDHRQGFPHVSHRM